MIRKKIIEQRDVNEAREVLKKLTHRPHHEHVAILADRFKVKPAVAEELVRLASM